MFLRPLFTTSCLVLILVSASGQAPPAASPSDEATKLQQQVRTLQAQLDLANARIAKLQAENAELKQALATLKEPTPEEANGIKTYKSVDEILLEMPAELRPKANVGWENNFALKDAQDWVSTVPVGHKYEATRAITKVLVQPQWSTAKERVWKITVWLDSEPIRFQGLNLRETYSNAGFTFSTTDAAYAERVEKLIRGNTRVVVTGTIHSLNLSLNQYPGRQVLISLNDWQIKTRSLTLPPPPTEE